MAPEPTTIMCQLFFHGRGLAVANNLLPILGMPIF